MAKRAECEYTIFCSRLKKRKKMLLKCLNGTLKFVGIDKVRARLRLNSNMHMQWFQVASLLVVCTMYIVHSMQHTVKCVHRVYIALHWRQTGGSAHTKNSVPINWKNFLFTWLLSLMLMLMFGFYFNHPFLVLFIFCQRILDGLFVVCSSFESSHFHAHYIK